MAALTTSSVVAAGLTDTLAAVAASDTFTNSGSEWIEVANASGGSINVTITASQTYLGETITSRVVAVGNGARKKIGPFPVAIFGTTTTVTCSATSSVTIGVFKVG